ncbi:hypothetical protein HER32_19140 [Hymenobacter sp. BT18]|uniref:hypothetical protein n=1 Tax=Hymenobacter sp. BT18 TaxID=2835648 RepID=UPI00143E5CBE|nr:hypothetical protein [Hymenobacter sp. BT18]QIX63169.1 hypothetical protein HER32_19140 [Hymenobacter sp. BT18]
MSNKLLVFLAGLLLLTALGSYVYYRRTVAQVPVDAWSLVPDDAVLVLATRDHPTLVRHLRETQLWDNLAALPYFQQVEENAQLLDSLTNSRHNLLRFLGRKTVLASVHITGPGSFDLLYQVPLNTVREYRQVRAAAEALARHPRFRVSSRTYQGHVLTAVQERGNGSGVTYFNYRNHLIISSNPGLIEKVIARIGHPGQASVAADFRNIDYLQLREVDATLLVNYRQLPPFLDVFFRPELRPSAQVLTGLGRNGLLEVQLAGNKLLMNGFTNPETARDALHQRVHGQAAQRLGMAEVVSLRTAVLMHLGVEQPGSLRTGRPLAAPDSATASALDSLGRQFTQEAALCYLAAPSPRQAPARLVLVRCQNPTRVATLLGQLRRARGSSPAFERVGPYQIHSLGLPEVPARLLGPMFGGFPAAGAVAQVGHYVAFADDPAALRPWLQDVAAGNVWTRSPTQVAFLQETQPLARFSLFLDTQNSWNVLLRGLREERRAGLLRNETLFKRFPQVTLQLVPAEVEEGPAGQYFTQILLRRPAATVATQTGSLTRETSGLRFPTPLTSPPVLVSVANARTPGILAQDSAYVLHYITPEGIIAWSDTLNGPLVGPVRRLALGGSQGFLVATPSRVYHYDVQGRAAPHFPLNLPDSVQASSLVTSGADGRQPARLLVGGGGGNFFLFDTNGNALPGWQPKRLDFAPAAPPHYLTIGGSDVLVVLLENGYIFAFDRAGGTYPGFPISVGARLHTAAFVEAGPTLQRSRLTVVTQQGERVQFNLSGYILNRNRLSTWTRGTTFRIIPDQLQRSYVVARQDPTGQLTIFDAAGRRLLTRHFLTADEKPVQFFDYGSGRRLVAITDPGPQQVYLFDAKGQLLNNQTFPSTVGGVQATYDVGANAWQLYHVQGRQLKRVLVPNDGRLPVAAPLR